jgi:hypothetical protein
MKRLSEPMRRDVAAARGPAIDGHELAEQVAVADHESRGFATVLEVLGREANRRKRREAIQGADRGVALDHHVGIEHRARSDATAGPTMQ